MSALRTYKRYVGWPHEFGEINEKTNFIVGNWWVNSIMCHSSCSYFGSAIFYEDPWLHNGKMLIQNAVNGREDIAITLLSADFAAKVQHNCPDGSVTKCINRLISPSWGNLTEIQFGAFEPSKDSLLLYTLWSNLRGHAVPVVIVINQVNGKWVIRGWRGFIQTKSEDEDGQLLFGTRHDNEFISPS
jgi:hypothetical protein